MCGPPWVYLAWNSLRFLSLVDFFLSHIREVFSYYLFIYVLRSSLSLSLLPFWDPYNVKVVAFNVVQEDS